MTTSGVMMMTAAAVALALSVTVAARTVRWARAASAVIGLLAIGVLTSGLLILIAPSPPTYGASAPGRSQPPVGQACRLSKQGIARSLRSIWAELGLAYAHGPMSMPHELGALPPPPPVHDEQRLLEELRVLDDLERSGKVSSEVAASRREGIARALRELQVSIPTGGR